MIGRDDDVERPHAKKKPRRREENPEVKLLEEKGPEENGEF
jgi:hypothetical protein